MRALALLAVALLLAVGVVSLRPGPSSLGAAVVSSVSAASPTERSGQAGAALAQQSAAGRARAEALRTELETAEVEATPPAPRRALDLQLLVLEHGSRAPLPEVGVEAWIYREREATKLPLAVAGDGSTLLTAEELRGATRLVFVLDDPELGPGQVVHLERPLDEVLARGEPLEVLVPRGAWREFLVVDRLGRPIEGATLEEYRLRPALSGPDGRGRVRLTAPPPRSVGVWAPGHRLEHAEVPPEGTPWVVELGGASRLELVLVGAEDLRGYLVEVRLPETMQQRTFYQSKYVQTPGRPLDGTPARWSSDSYRGPSRWSLGFNDAGLAVLDQLYDEGAVEVELLRFGESLDLRAIALAPEGRTTRVELRAPAPPPALAGRVVDEAHLAVSGVLVRMAPFGGGATIDLAGRPGFPVWAPSAVTNATGEFRLPRPRDSRTVLVVSRRGLADRALTVAELDAADGVVELERGRTVVLEVLGRDGEPLDGGHSTGMAYLHVRPSVHLGHDVWRDASPSDHPAAEGRDTWIPTFLFADLASGMAEFRFTYLSGDERLWHDTSVPTARFVSRSVLDELGIGK